MSTDDTQARRLQAVAASLAQMCGGWLMTELKCRFTHATQEHRSRSLSAARRAAHDLAGFIAPHEGQMLETIALLELLQRSLILLAFSLLTLFRYFAQQQEHYIQSRPENEAPNQVNRSSIGH